VTSQPHDYQWLGNVWRCLRCDVEIRNRDCPYNETLVERRRTWRPVDPEAGQLAVFLAAVVAIVGLWLLLIAAGLSLRGLG
jgi:hypothetical protein